MSMFVKESFRTLEDDIKGGNFEWSRVQIENPLSRDSSECDESAFDFGGIVGFIPTLGFHLLKVGPKQSNKFSSIGEFCIP